MADFRAIADAVKAGRAKVVKTLVNEALAEGANPEALLNEGLVVGMNELGIMFKNNEVYVPEVLIAARAMKAGTEILKPLLAAANVQSLGKVAIGTVKGDLHDIGKNLVGMMLEGAGFTVIDLGVDVSPEQYVDAVANQGAQIVGMSALLTTTMPSIKDGIEALKAAGLRDKVRVMIGGAPVTQSFADEVGADGYSSDAASAADLAKELIKQL
ncbi:MAG TPA: corrinoid protein [Candidatus Faecaligallichristensenella faecipullorum]|nr:corrinoid protein [Candidatus Faecaligallichristensenella faecipullorum]